MEDTPLKTAKILQSRLFAVKIAVKLKSGKPLPSLIFVVVKFSRFFLFAVTIRRQKIFRVVIMRFGGRLS